MNHLRIIHCYPNIIAYYDGRIPDYRFMPEKNWVDDGAISLGTASFAIISGSQALVYDTHVSLEHAKLVREDLEKRGVNHITVLLSHWHLDHVAGNEIFADCEIIANKKTLSHLTQHKKQIEDATHHGAPAIKPLFLPNRIFESEMEFQLGDMPLKFIEANIHSDDASVVWIESLGILLAGDTMEDTITYVGAPQDFNIHLAELDRLWALSPTHILPCHGAPEILAAGGYGKSFIRAQQQYIRMLKRCRDDEALRQTPLRQLISGPLEAGWVNYFEPYEEVHQQNLLKVLVNK